jgi:DNA-binding SARP family transcriptional activator
MMDGTQPRLELCLLGTVRARWGTSVLDLGAVKAKSLLAALVLHEGKTLPKDTVIEAVWGQDPPLTAENLIADYLSRLRMSLAPAKDAIRLRSMLWGSVIRIWAIEI